MHLQSVQKCQQRPQAAPELSQSSTPQFTTAVKERYYRAYIEQTERKNSFSPNAHQPPAALTSNLLKQSPSKDIHSGWQMDHDGLLRKLDQTQERLVRSQKNYAEVWRKYQKQIERNQNLTRQLQSSEKERLQQLISLQNKISMLQNQHATQAQSLFSAQSSVSHLQSTLIDRNSTISRLQQSISDLTAKLAVATSRQLKAEGSASTLKEKQREIYVHELEKEVFKWEELVKFKDRQRKNIIEESQKKENVFKAQVEQMRESQRKIQAQYANWVELAKKQKVELISSYESKLQSVNNNLTSTSMALLSLQSSLTRLPILQEENSSLLAQLDQLTSQNKSSHDEVDRLRREREELVGKVAAMQNQLILKGQIDRNGWERGERMAKMLKDEQQKNAQTNKKYNQINTEFMELKTKCSIIFSESQQLAKERKSLKSQLSHLSNELNHAKQQITTLKSAQLALNGRFNTTISSLKAQMQQCQNQKEDLLADLLAQRLQNAKLREQLHDTRTSMRQQYQLSLENTKRELSHRIEQEMQLRSGKPPSSYDEQKQELYLKLRDLQRKYEYMKAEMVTVNDVMSLRQKAERRFTKNK